MDRCPGSDLRYITAQEVPCPECGAMVELFSDEQRRRCPACGARVVRDSAPPCASWCDAAKACLGAKRYEELLAAGVIDDRTKGEDEDPSE